LEAIDWLPYINNKERSLKLSLLEII